MPQEDITTYELASVLATAGLQMNYDGFSLIPEEAKRHFVRVDDQ